MSILSYFRKPKSNPTKSFEEVRQFLSSIDFIHCGGCGISTYAMYLWLKKNHQLGKNFKFVLGYKNYSEGDYLNNQDVLRNRKGNAIAPSHMFILHNDNYIDCKRSINLSEYTWIQHVDNEWFVKNCINNIDTWNPTFNRGNIILIEKELNIKLNLK